MIKFIFSKIKVFLFLGIMLVLGYFIHPIFYIAFILAILFLFYPLFRRIMTPKGKRIKRQMLKDYLMGKYGKEGKKIYGAFIRELKKRGYR